jgi:hypothetical protein
MGVWSYDFVEAQNHDGGHHICRYLLVERNQFSGRSICSNRLTGAAKMSQRALIISLQAKIQISLTTVAAQSSMDLMAEGFKM